SRRYRKENKEKINRKRRKLYNTNEKIRQKRLKMAAKYFQKNREKTYKYKKKKYDNDKSYKISVNMRNRINNVLNGNQKSTSADKLIGCSWKELKQHLENQFEDGMTWENHSRDGWHVDHIIPCNVFDLTNPYAQAVCFHYSNLRPMWGSDNISKYDSIPDLGIEIDKEWVQNRGMR
ncbi:MAG TPA: hypothetical protein VLA13_03930, partial [Massilibacterium sp.]|nr:hypothetical protein [Massilibacterium sp.]